MTVFARGWALPWLLLTGALCGWSHPATADGWTIAEVEGWPGDHVDVELVFRGDGIASGADLRIALNPARLTIEAPAGTLAQGAQAGQCGWNGAPQASALYVSATPTPLPELDTVVCVLPIRIRADARPGRVLLTARAANCPGVDGDSA